MIVLVCGGRDYSNIDHIFKVLDFLHCRIGIERIIHGGAQGADAIADKWASDRDIPAQRVLADWAKHGKAAGPIRNQEMLDVYPIDMVVAFPGGRGTADMVRRARAEDIIVFQEK